MNSSKLKLAAALAVIFALGAVAGVSLSRFCPPHPFFHSGAPDMQEHLTRFLTARLNLTADQQQKLAPIAADFGREAETLHAQSVKAFADLADQTDDRIAVFLTPEQKADFDKIRQQRRQDFHDHGAPFDGPPGGPGPHGPPPGWPDAPPPRPPPGP
jgi:Spy/CpxP family protein refolding chaperone